MARAPGARPSRAEEQAAGLDATTEPKKSKLPKGLSVDWFSIKPREIMARLDDGTLLRCWQTRTDADGAWTWYCYRGSHAIGVAGSMEEAKRVAQHAPVPPRPTSEELDARYAPEPPAPSQGKRGETEPSSPETKPRVASGVVIVKRGKLDPTLSLTLVQTQNPKKADAARRYEFYRTCGTVGEYCAAVGSAAKGEADIRWDSKQGWITVGGKDD